MTLAEAVTWLPRDGQDPGPWASRFEEKVHD